MRASIRRNEFPEGVHVDISTHNDWDRELTRRYPIVATIRAYEVSREALAAVCDEFGLSPDETPTGGVIGGDGGHGWAPAVNFEQETGYMESFGNAYVVPWPEIVRPITRGHDWDRVARAVINTFRY